MAAAKRRILLIILTSFGVTLTSVTLFAYINKLDIGTVKGKIIDIKSLGRGTVQSGLDEITYVYSINGKDYSSKKRIGVRYPKQALGNGVKVEYSIEHPEQSEAVGFYMDFKSSDNRVEFHASKKYGYHSIELINDLYYYTNYVDSGVVIDRIVGQWTTNKDTLIVKPYNHEIENKYRTVKYVMVETPNSNRRFGIKNLSNNRVFK